MKTLLFSTLYLLLSTSAFADSWTCMSLEEAETLKAYLEEEKPYILDYCDCCGSEGELVKVNEVSIVACDYDDALYSVVVTGMRAGFLSEMEEGHFQDYQMAEGLHDAMYEHAVSLNYAFALAEGGKAQTLASAIDAHTWDGEPCIDNIHFPSAAMIDDSAYTAFLEEKE